MQLQYLVCLGAHHWSAWTFAGASVAMRQRHTRAVRSVFWLHPVEEGPLFLSPRAQSRSTLILCQRNGHTLDRLNAKPEPCTDVLVASARPIRLGSFVNESFA